MFKFGRFGAKGDSDPPTRKKFDPDEIKAYTALKHHALRFKTSSSAQVGQHIAWVEKQANNATLADLRSRYRRGLTKMVTTLISKRVFNSEQDAVEYFGETELNEAAKEADALQSAQQSAEPAQVEEIDPAGASVQPSIFKGSDLSNRGLRSDDLKSNDLKSSDLRSNVLKSNDQHPKSRSHRRNKSVQWPLPGSAPGRVDAQQLRSRSSERSSFPISDNNGRSYRDGQGRGGATSSLSSGITRMEHGIAQPGALNEIKPVTPSQQLPRSATLPVLRSQIPKVEKAIRFSNQGPHRPELQTSQHTRSHLPETPEHPPTHNQNGRRGRAFSLSGGPQQDTQKPRHTRRKSANCAIQFQTPQPANRSTTFNSARDQGTRPGSRSEGPRPWEKGSPDATDLENELATLSIGPRVNSLAQIEVLEAMLHVLEGASFDLIKARRPDLIAKQSIEKAWQLQPNKYAQLLRFATAKILNSDERRRLGQNFFGQLTFGMEDLRNATVHREEPPTVARIRYRLEHCQTLLYVLGDHQRATELSRLRTKLGALFEAEIDFGGKEEMDDGKMA